MPVPVRRGHKWLIVLVALLMLAGLGAAYAVMHHASSSTGVVCPGVVLWSGQGLGMGQGYCAKPGTGPSDLPFIPQSFFIPAGSSMGFKLTGATTANNGTGSITLSLTGNATSEASIVSPSTITQVTSFAVTA